MLVLLIFSFLLPADVREKMDVVVLKNGERITGRRGIQLELLGRRGG
jgi:hypothetical protein